MACGHPATGRVVQRMIDKDVPAEAKSDLQKLKEYVYATPINNRGQTFEQAALGNDLGVLVNSIAEGLKDGNVERVLAAIGMVRDRVNRLESQEPVHPNKVWGKNKVSEATQHEAPFSISRTPESDGTARKIQQGVLKHKGWQGTKFMLGVLAAPNGQFIVGVSGGGNGQTDIVKEVAKGWKIPLLGGEVYGTGDIAKQDRSEYEQSAANHVHDHHHEMQKAGRDPIFDYAGPNRIERQRTADKTDLGSYVAACAAPVVISIAHQHPNLFQGQKILGLTEVWIALKDSSQVMVYNTETGHGDKFNKDDSDVPSCHVCQMQLEPVAKKVVKLEREGILAGLQQNLQEGADLIAKSKIELEQLGKLKAANQAEADKIPGLEDLIHQSQTETSRLQDEIRQKNSLARRKESEISVLKQKVKKAERAIKKEEDNINKQDGILKSQKAQGNRRDFLEKQIKGLSEEVTTLEQEIETLNNTGTFLNGYKAWYEKAKQLNKAHGLGLGDNNEALKQVPNAMRLQAEKRKDARSQHQGELNSLPTDDEIKETAEKALASKKLSNKKLNGLDGPESYRKDLKQAQDALDQLETEVATLRTEVKGLKDKVDQEQGQTDKLEESLAEPRAAKKAIRDNDREIRKKTKLIKDTEAQMELDTLRVQGTQAGMAAIGL